MTTTTIKTLDPEAILAEVKSHPPLMRAQAQRAYIGRRVAWRLPFTQGSIQGGTASLTFLFDRGFGTVSGSVPLARYPWLKSLPADTALHLTGRIQKLTPLGIDIEISTLRRERAGSRKTTSTRALHGAAH